MRLYMAGASPQDRDGLVLHTTKRLYISESISSSQQASAGLGRRVMDSIRAFCKFQHAIPKGQALLCLVSQSHHCNLVFH